MERNINSLIGNSTEATNGIIGEVKDFYFDDEAWKIRYLIVKTGSWLSGREVLISSVALKDKKWLNNYMVITNGKAIGAAGFMVVVQWASACLFPWLTGRC
jgi:hypothetical protein